VSEADTKLAKKSAAPIPTSNGRPLNGNEKGLLFLVSLEERVATAIMGHLDQEEIAWLRSASDSLTEVEAPAITAVHYEFIERVRAGVPASLKGSSAYLRRLAGKALGEGKVAEVWADKRRPEGPVAALAALDIPTIMALLEHEKPQTLAVILTLFEPVRAAELISRMEPSKQADIVARMARLSSIPETVIRELEDQFKSELDALGDDRRRILPGLQAAANLLKRLDSEVSEELMDALEGIDEALAEDLKKNLFVFEDLLRIDGRGMQVLLKEVATDQLVLALKSASDDLKEKVFGNVSSRAVALLREELGLLGPVRLSEVEEAQQAICAVTMQLEQEGRIQIAQDGGDYV
jgi:flagellar motor switch protein FliG